MSLMRTRDKLSACPWGYCPATRRKLGYIDHTTPLVFICIRGCIYMCVFENTMTGREASVHVYSTYMIQVVYIGQETYIYIIFHLITFVRRAIYYFTLYKNDICPGHNSTRQFLKTELIKKLMFYSRNE
uniref:Uncharacterized protein n=1 Tax=Trichogramma kaykai TaxID=54128 RepID=A0ABD2XA63_9HYME